MVRSNLGGISRAVRILAGIGLLAMVFVGPQTTWGFLGLALLFTAMTGVCAENCPLGGGTCRVPKQ